MSFRIEKDTMGEIKVFNDKFWGSQNQRSLENFIIGNEKMPIQVIHALTLIKNASAISNRKLGKLSKEKMELIVLSCDEILNNKLNNQFPLSIWQTGSGTQTNMNVNEVISNFAIFKKGGILGSKDPIHPNDDVNKSQSSNDVFPAAMQISAVIEINNKLLPNALLLIETLDKKTI